MTTGTGGVALTRRAQRASIASNNSNNNNNTSTGPTTGSKLKTSVNGPNPGTSAAHNPAKTQGTKGTSSGVKKVANSSLGAAPKGKNNNKNTVLYIFKENVLVFVM